MTTGQIIRELENVEERYRNEKLFTGEVSRSAMAYDCRKKIEKLAEYEDLGEPEELQRKSEWISVEERLPPLDETGYTYVLVQMNDEFITATDYTRNGGFGLWKDSGEVTHWMPLPEPPKE